MKSKQTELLPDVKLRIVRVNKNNPNDTVEKIMTYEEWKNLTKQKGYNYTAYQI